MAQRHKAAYLPLMAPKITFAGRKFHLPGRRIYRLGLGVVLIIGGILGFLPVLGFWMIPLGVLVLSYDFHTIRRGRRRFAVWWGKKFRKSQDQAQDKV